MIQDHAKRRYVMIVSAAIAPTCRQLAALVPSASGMWVSGYRLASAGPGPAQVYVSDGDIEERFGRLMTDAQALSDAISAYGGDLSLAQAQALLSQAVIVPDRLGADVLAELGYVPAITDAGGA